MNSLQALVTGAPLAFETFNTAYCALTGHDSACRWQYRLFQDLEAGRFPTDIELATGLGKTSIIALWTLALGRALEQGRRHVPRRLAYVVDRRVVVDQASEFAEAVRERLTLAANHEDHPLHAIALALRRVGCTSSVIEVSTLRGQRALDTTWRDDPTRPAVIVGTVDMIGSRLLFSAYGRAGPWGRALEAGLFGQDCLLVLDEAHLCSPFAATLASIYQRASRALAPFCVVRMGATMAPVRDLLGRTAGLTEAPKDRRVFRLLDDDTTIDGQVWLRETVEEKVNKRLEAKKRIEVEPLDADRGAGAQLATWAIDKSRAAEGAVIGIVLNTVVEVRRCVTALKNGGVADEKIVTLTGSMRGWDRDKVVESPRYARLKSQRDRSVSPASSTFLVATSCVEVGADIDCDHLGTEACAADSLIQRLGRVNRLGESTFDVTVRVVGEPNATDPAGSVFKRIQALVAQEGNLQGSPASFPARLVDDLDEKEQRALFEVRVPPPALTRAVLDDFAMTSKYPKQGARPDVGRWLHGSIEDSALYVDLAWRKELDHFLMPEEAERLISAFPISARETARCPLHEAVELLKAIRKRATEDEGLGARVLVVMRFGVAKGICIRDVPKEDDRALRTLLCDAMVALPTSAGGYDGQFVNPESKEGVVDVADEAQPSSRARRRRLWIDSGSVSQDGGGGVPQPIDVDTESDELLDEVAAVADELLGPGWRLVEAAGNGRLGVIVAREDRRALEEAEDDDAALGFSREVLLSDHLGDARKEAEELCRRLDLPDTLRETVIEAAGQHDLGKDRPWWQRAVGRVEKPAIAKSEHVRFDHKVNRGYRHEVGSVADLMSANVPASIDRELCLHLVAAHHGHARPDFRHEAAGPLLTDAVRRALSETPDRFARLQAKYGWWALAWLEGLVKAADVLASRKAEQAP